MANDPNSNRPAFSAPLWAAARQGAKELSQALHAFPDSVRVVEEPGTIGNPTSQMVTEQVHSTEGCQQMLADRSRESGPAERPGPELDR